MASNPIYDPPANHWVHIPALRRYTGFDKFTNKSFIKLKDPNDNIAKQYEDILRQAGVWDSQSNHVIDWLLDWHTGTWTYYKQVDSDFIPNTLTNEQVKGYIDYVENTAQDIRDDDAREQVIVDINNSQHRCLELIGPTDRKDRAKVYFEKNGSQQKAKKNGNNVGLRTDIAFVGVPKTAAGTAYSAGLTDKTDQTGTYESGEIGHDNRNAIAAPLDMNYNHNTGMFELASTFLAKLLTNVEAVPIVENNIDVSNINGRTSSDFYGKNAPEKMSDFKTGVAAPLSMQNKNPHCYGPNILKCKTNSKVETVRVVNRSNISYKKGEIVTVFKVDGENLIGKYTSDQFIQLPPVPGRWVFAQFYAGSDEYFRYEPNAAETSTNRPSLLPDDCLDLFRRKYYQQMSILEPSARIGGGSAHEALLNFSPTMPTGNIFSYFPWEVFDLIQDRAGYINGDTFVPGEPPPNEEPGAEDLFERTTRLETYFDQINVTAGKLVNGVRTDVTEYTDPTYLETPMFWGPVFVNGLRTKVNRLTSPKSGPGGKWKCNFLDDIHTPAFAAMPHNLDFVEIVKLFNLVPLNLNFYPKTHLNLSNLKYPYFDLSAEMPVYTQNLVEPNDPLTVQFTALTAELVGASDPAASLDVLPPSPVGVFGGNPRPRAFYSNSARIVKEINSQYSYPNGSFLLQKTLARRPSVLPIKTLLGLPQSPLKESSILAQLPATANTLPYDWYTSLVPLNRPIGAFSIFGGDLAPRTEPVASYRGANGVGITAAKLRMNQGSGGSWTVNFDVKQSFGQRGRWFGGGGGGGINITTLGSLLWATDTRGRRTEGIVPTWGSYSDAIDSFGTAALHVRAWDAWPEEQTVWIPQYFTPLHFNPIAIIPSGSSFMGTTSRYDSLERPNSVTLTNYANAVKQANSDEWESNKKPDTNFKLNIFSPNTSVDYRVPTYGGVREVINKNGSKSYFPAYSTTSAYADPALISYNILSPYISEAYGLDGITVPIATPITSGTILRQESLWNLNIGRRGRLVTKYGFFYHRPVIGVDKNTLTMIDDPELTNANYPWAENFATGDEFELPDGVIVQYTAAQDGGFGSFNVKQVFLVKDNVFQEEEFKKFYKYSGPIPDPDKWCGIGTYTSVSFFAIGSGLMPSDFGPGGKQYVIKPKNGGKNRYIKFTQGMCEAIYGWDSGPMPRSRITRLTNSSGDGTQHIYGKKATSLAVLGNSDSRYKGQYELYFHMHNDIGIALHERAEETGGIPFNNYFIVNIA